MRKTAAVLCIIIFVGLFVSGCKNSDKGDGTGGYKVYFLKSSQNELTYVNYKIDSNDYVTVIKGLLEYMKDGADSKNDCRSVFDNDMTLPSFKLENDVLYMYFDENYSNMDKISEVLFRAAIVKTVMQAEGVNHVSFYVNDEPLLGSNQTVIGLMDDATFVSDIKGNVKSENLMEIPVYFADESGTKLVADTISIAYDNSVTGMQAAIEALIAGPETEGLYRTVPAELKLIGITLNDGVCYVDFDSTFTDVMVDVTAEVSLYSVVNSLCEFTDVKMVQILVDGSSEGIFREVYSLSDIYERNLDIVLTTD